MRKASLGTLFLTVFLDLLGFGLVIPFLPGVARDMGASDLVATLLGASYSLMQFIFIPLWGRLSDRHGRRPVLLASIAASALGMVMLGLAPSLFVLFLARIWSGIATANIAVAQAYISDVTSPETRARGMGMIGMAFGLGFILGPFVGGELGHVVIFGRPGALAAFVAAGLSVVNLVLAVFSVPESLPPEAPGSKARAGVRHDVASMRAAFQMSGVSIALAINFLVVFWFAGMEQTFRLFTDDAFGMTMAGTGRVLGFVGVVAVVVQGGLIHPLTRLLGEARLIRAGAFCLAAAFALTGVSPDLGGWARVALFAGAGLIAAGSGLVTPSVSSYVSRRADAGSQGATLGALQSVAALARVFGPAAGGIAYQLAGRTAPYYLGSVGMLLAALLALGLRPIPRRTGTAAAPAPSAPSGGA